LLVISLSYIINSNISIILDKNITCPPKEEVKRSESKGKQFRCLFNKKTP